RRTLTASVTLAVQLWVTLAPTIAYAQDAATSEPTRMVPLSEYERIGGGSLSTAGDRAAAATNDVGQGEGPQASNGEGLGTTDAEGSTGQNDGNTGPAREGENEGAPTEEGEEGES